MGAIGDYDLGVFLEQDIDSDKSSLLRIFFGCLASSLTPIHNASVRHKDIRPKNDVIRGATVMYTDFSLALDYSQTNRSTT